MYRFRGSARKRCGCFSSVYTLACRTELNYPVRDGRAGKINGNYVCTFAFEESNPPAAVDDGRSVRFPKKSHRSATGLTQATCVHANYLTLPSRKTKVCISNTGSRITRTSGITVHIYVKYRTAGARSDNRELWSSGFSPLKSFWITIDFIIAILL